MPVALTSALLQFCCTSKEVGASNGGRGLECTHVVSVKCVCTGCRWYCSTLAGWKGKTEVKHITNQSLSLAGEEICVCVLKWCVFTCTCT